MSTKGYTLIEVLISVALLAFLLMVTAGVLMTGNTVFNNNMYQLDMHQQARTGLDRIVREVRESSAQTVTVVDSDHDRITFTTPNETGIQYYVSGTNLVREYPSGTVRIVASKIARLKFTLATKLLTVEIRADTAIGSKTYSIGLKDKVRLRN